MFMQLELEEPLVLEVEFDFSEGTEERFSNQNLQWLPPESDEILNLKVSLNGHDITKLLTQSKIDSIKRECLQAAYDENR